MAAPVQLGVKPLTGWLTGRMNLNLSRAYGRWRRRREIDSIRRELGLSEQDATLEMLRRETARIFGVPVELVVHDGCECFPDGGPCGEAAEFGGTVPLSTKDTGCPVTCLNRLAPQCVVHRPAEDDADDPKTADEALRLGWTGFPAPGSPAWRREREGTFVELCHGDRDGECHWKKCPQLADGEPVRSGRHCPLDLPDEMPAAEWHARYGDDDASELGRGIAGN